MKQDELKKFCDQCGHQFQGCRDCKHWLKFKREHKGPGRPVIPHRTGGGMR